MGLLLLIPIINFVPLGVLVLTGIGAFWRARSAMRKARKTPATEGGATGD